MCEMRVLPQVAACVPLLLTLAFMPSRVSASEGTQEPPADTAEEARPTLEHVRGNAGLFGGFATTGADGLDSGAVFGGSAAFFFTDRLGIEAGVRRRSLDVTATPSNVLSGGSLDSTVVTGSVVFRFPGARVAPYLLAGVAYFSNTFEVAPAIASDLAALNFQVSEDVKSSLGFNVGAGADFLVASRFALFGEVRYLAGSMDTAAELTDTISGTAAETEGSQDLNGLEMRAGVRFVFGTAPRKVP